MKKIIFFVFLYSTLLANNYFSVKDYKFLNSTSPSLQDLIYEYHTYIKNNPDKFIFDLESMDDGTEENKKYKNFFETKKGYKGANLLYIKAKAGGNKFAIIGRQLGSSNYNVNTMTHDYVFMGRKLFLKNNLDIMFGINLHDEPKYETIDNREYFTDDIKSDIRFLTDIVLFNVNISIEMKQNKVEKTLFAYNFNTKYGIITPKYVKGYDEIKYNDFYLIYDSDVLFDRGGFYIRGLLKNRQIDNKDKSYQKGMIAKVIEIEKYLGILKIYAGYSESTEFTKELLKGDMLKVGLTFPKKYLGKRKAEYYFGTSRNYYYDLVNLRAINQRMTLFGVKIYW